ncbi:MAG: hypothetical protein WB782_07000 [Thermoplasmata archaeon]
MKSESDERLIARLYLNLKGGKRKRDAWTTIARDTDELVKRSGSLRSAAQRLGVSTELVRAICSINTLPPAVLRIVDDPKKGIGMDAAQRLTGLSGPERIIAVASAIRGMPSHDQRQVIQFARANPSGDIEEFKERVMTSKARREKIGLLVVPLSGQLMLRLQELSRRRKLSLQQYVSAELEKVVARPKGGSR